jgi:hypothetical protein
MVAILFNWGGARAEASRPERAALSGLRSTLQG